ncbi:RimK family alpha-L-glutamate ligase [Chlamydiales bacterium]|nr:RimK family alpha-L-glutamate ligase [Chlamydiales bacterium]
MKGLILFNESEEGLTSQHYDILRLLKAARKLGHDIKVVCPEQFELVATKSDRKSILIDGKSEQLPNYVLPRMGSETTYFGLAVIRQLERLGVYCCNSSSSIERVRDKLHVYQILAQSNLSTPRTMMVKFPVDLKLVKREIGFPVVVKNIIGTRGEGIYLSESEDRFLDLMELIYSYNQQANIILQEYISTSHGKDLRVFVIGGKVVGCMQRKAKSGFKANYSLGGSVEPFPLSEEIERLAIETAQLMDLEIAGVDLLFDKGGFKICEANSAPDFEGLEKVVGNHIAEDILDYTVKKVSTYSGEN